jgi:hypothetical protein
VLEGALGEADVVAVAAEVAVGLVGVLDGEEALAARDDPAAAALVEEGATVADGEADGGGVEPQAVEVEVVDEERAEAVLGLAQGGAGAGVVLKVADE